MDYVVNRSDRQSQSTPLEVTGSHRSKSGLEIVVVLDNIVRDNDRHIERKAPDETQGRPDCPTRRGSRERLAAQ